MSKIDYTKLLTDFMKSNPAWVDFARAVSDAYYKEVDFARKELQKIRSGEILNNEDEIEISEGTGTITKVVHKNSSGDSDLAYIEINGTTYEKELDLRQDKKYLIENSKQLGFDFYSDLLTKSDYYRVFKHISQYWPEGGTEQFVNFMGFIKNIRLTVDQLWTNDYENFEDSPLGTLVTDSGTWYPTSHVEIEYNPDELTPLDFEDITKLFYFLAPIHLVLKRLKTTVNFGEGGLYLYTAGIHEIEFSGKDIVSDYNTAWYMLDKLLHEKMATVFNSDFWTDDEYDMEGMLESLDLLINTDYPEIFGDE